MSGGWLFAALGIVSALCIMHLWVRRPGSIAKKLLWTAILLFPIIGPLFYGAIYESLSEQEDVDRAVESDTDGDDTDPAS